MIYLVYKPTKFNKDSLELVTDDVEKAKTKAREIRDFYLAKGWDSWAKKVKIQSPKDKQTALTIANELIEWGNTLQMMHSAHKVSWKAEWYWEQGSKIRKVYQ